MERDTAARTIGRYVLFREVAHGEMATVHLGRLRGPAGFARTVAIKRLHAQYARDPEFVSMFLEEARLAARIQHPNVVSVLDVVASEGELFLVMDYVHGESFSKLVRTAAANDNPASPRVVAAIVCNVLDGLHAAHEARNERGDPLGIVHRDVSPQNVLVGADGVARVLDFGIAKATQHVHNTTRDGQMKGKVPYMAPEQIQAGRLDRRTDVYSASVLLWEALTGKRLFEPADVITIVKLVLEQKHPAPSAVEPRVPPALDSVVARGLARRPEDRFATAHDMAIALERAAGIASPREVGEWVRGTAQDSLAGRMQSITEIENASLPAFSPSEAPSFMKLPPDVAVVASSAALAPTTVSPDVDSVDVDFGDQPAGVGGNRLRRWVLVGGGLALAAAVVMVFVFARAHRGAPAADAAPTAPPAAASTFTVPPPPPASSVATPLPDTTSSGAAPSASKAAPGWGRSRPGARPGCNPPYTIDANGVRVPKRQCF